MFYFLFSHMTVFYASNLCDRQKFKNQKCEIRHQAFKNQTLELVNDQTPNTKINNILKIDSV